MMIGFVEVFTDGSDDREVWVNALSIVSFTNSYRPGYFVLSLVNGSRLLIEYFPIKEKPGTGEQLAQFIGLQQSKATKN